MFDIAKRVLYFLVNIAAVGMVLVVILFALAASPDPPGWLIELLRDVLSALPDF